MSVNLKEILKITIDENHETASLNMRNGDALKGVINLEPIKLETAFGDVAIGIEHVREIDVSMVRGTAKEAPRKVIAGGSVREGLWVTQTWL